MESGSDYWTVFWQRRASRRGFLRAAGGLGAAGLLAACAPSQQTTPAGGAAPAPGTTEGVPQVLKHGIANPPVTLDPNGTALSSSYFYALYDALTRVDHAAKIHPGLAESWRPVSETVWEFKLRTTKWSDGSPFTADDVKWTYEYVLDPGNKSAIASRISNVESVSAVDPQTVRIATKGPDPLMPARAFFIPILPKAYIGRVGIQEFSLKPIGTGAFKIQEYRQGSRAVLVPNDQSWRKPKLQEVWLLELPEASTRLAALRTGEVDAADFISRQDAQRMQSDPAFNVVIGEGAGSYNFDVEFFTPPYNDKRVRIALNHAIDKEAILKNLLLGFGRVMDGQLIPRNVFGYNPNLKPFEYDPRKARELLAAAGLPNGFDTAIEFSTTTAEARLIAEAMFQYLGDIGVRAELRPVEVGVWRQHIYEGGRSPIFWNPWSAQAPLDAEFIYSWYGADSFNNKPYWKNDAFEAAYSRSRRELDPQRRLTYLQEAAAAMREDPPCIFMIQGVSLWVTAKKVQNFIGTASGYIWYDDIQIVRA
ncbi:MAG: ABC transporter substrate-binding protein [Dehalococcoidia bacterium]|nr:MAG: ABC transporter substrate-binding protein [Dehalococcoidia bacterium]